MNKPKILVIGDVFLDRYTHLLVTRLSPEAPVPVGRFLKDDYRLGGAGNVAANLANFAHTTLLSIVGNDEHAEVLKGMCDSYGFDVNFVRSNSGTIIKNRFVANGTQMLRVDWEERFSPEDTENVFRLLEQIVFNFDAVIVSDYNKGTVGDFSTLYQKCREKNILVFVDPKGGDYRKYNNSFLIKPNLNEFVEISNSSCTESHGRAQSAISLINDINIENIIITLGADGYMVVNRQHGMISTGRSLASEVFDVTGAGDTFLGIVCLETCKGQTLVRAAEIANAAAAKVVSRFGTSVISVDEYEEISKVKESKAVAQTRTCSSVDALLAHPSFNKNKRIVFTNGCFDILHAGHIDYLMECKNYGDVLVVAINGDESVAALKGSQRPVFPLEKRIEALCAIRVVDFIIPFYELTPLNLIKTLKPDVLIKGGDYKKEEIVGFHEVLANGGQVKTLPLLAGFSTSKIIEAVRGSYDEK